jgi:hypothetical protein
MLNVCSFQAHVLQEWEEGEEGIWAPTVTGIVDWDRRSWPPQPFPSGRCIFFQFEFVKCCLEFAKFLEFANLEFVFANWSVIFFKYISTSNIFVIEVLHIYPKF